MKIRWTCTILSKCWTCIILHLCFSSLYGQNQDSTYFWDLYELGRSKCKTSDFYNAKVLLENTLSEIKESDYSDFRLEARIMTDIAWAYAGLRDNVSENIYLETALKIYVDNLKQGSEEYAAALHDMALTQGERKKFQYAIELLDSSTAVFKTHLPELYEAGRASNLVALGWLYREQGNYSQSIMALQEAVELIKLEGGDHYTNMGSVQHILGYTLMYNGDLEEALPHLLEGKKIRKKKLGAKDAKYHQSLLKIAECYTYLGNYENALIQFDTIIKSLQNRQISISSEGIQLDSINSWYTLLQTYVAKGNVYLYQYKIDPNPIHLESNLEWYSKAIEVIQKILLYYPSKEGQFQTLRDYGFLFDNCINNAVILYNYYQDPKYLEKAFQVSELSRGFTFLEALHKSHTQDFLDVPKELLEKESELNIKMQKFELGKEEGSQDSQDWIKMNLELQKIQQKIKKEYPGYFDLKSNLIVPTIEEIQQKLNANTAIVEYYEGQGQIYAFIIGKDSATVRSFVTPKDYSDLIADVISNISKNPIVNNKSLKALNKNCEQLYQWLIAPLESSIQSKQSIVFIPHKKLNYLPFEVLIKEDTVSNEANYLIQDYAISYDFSCTSLFTNNTKPLQAKYNYHGIAPGIRSDILTDESINEIKQAYKIWGGKYSMGKNANRNTLFQGLKDANIVHIVAHSKLDTMDITEFALILNDTKINKVRDSVYIEDIYLSEINSSLIILSGCQTADGLLKDGEGLLSLTNAFKYAGANSLTCSLWETENKIGNKIISDYISRLENGQLKDVALQSTKLHFIQSADALLKHPFYWSTFVNVGNQEAISKLNNYRTNSSIIYAMGFVLFILTIGILIKQSRKSKN